MENSGVEGIFQSWNDIQQNPNNIAYIYIHMFM